MPNNEQLFLDASELECIQSIAMSLRQIVALMADHTRILNDNRDHLDDRMSDLYDWMRPISEYYANK
jgi:hypothetical protein